MVEEKEEEEEEERHLRSRTGSKLALQPRHQGFLGVQNGGLEKTEANSRSRVSKNIGDFDCFKLAAGKVTKCECHQTHA